MWLAKCNCICFGIWLKLYVVHKCILFRFFSFELNSALFCSMCYFYFSSLLLMFGFSLSHPYGYYCMNFHLRVSAHQKENPCYMCNPGENTYHAYTHIHYYSGRDAWCWFGFDHIRLSMWYGCVNERVNENEWVKKWMSNWAENSTKICIYVQYIFCTWLRSSVR